MWTEDGPKGVAKWDAIYEWAGSVKRRVRAQVDAALDWCDDNLYVAKIKSTWQRRVLLVCLAPVSYVITLAFELTQTWWKVTCDLADACHDLWKAKR